ncbi:MAG: sodium:calcium antiporter [Candidatus Eisenbacteria bacterium]
MENLIPPRWFEPLSVWVLLIVTAASLSAMIRGADWLVDAAAGTARRFRVSKIVIGATVVSLGTTSPEATVSVLAAWSGQPGLALGNAVGSICAGTGLIFGLACLLDALPADRFVLKRQGWVQFGAALLLASLCYGAFARHGDAAVLSRWAGGLLLALLVAYVSMSIRWGRQHSRLEAGAAPSKEDAAGEQGADGPALGTVVTPDTIASPPMVHLVARGLLGLILVILGSQILIRAVTVLAVRWGVPEVVIAATLVAAGISLPGFIVGMTSILKGHGEILIGNVIGSGVLNVLFVTGAAAAAANLPLVEVGSHAPRIFLHFHLPAMLLIVMLFRIFALSAAHRGRFQRWFGVPLLAVYVIYVVGQYVLSL